MANERDITVPKITAFEVGEWAVRTRLRVPGELGEALADVLERADRELRKAEKATRRLAPFEQPKPEVAELLERAEWLDGNPDDSRWGGASLYASELRAHAAALVELAEWLDGNPDDSRWGGASLYASELRAHAAALVELAEARAKFARVKELPHEWETGTEISPGMRMTPGPLECIEQLRAALAGAGGEREVTG